MRGVLDGVDARGYHGVWRIWKLGSLCLFAAFVGIAADIALSLRRHTGRRA